MHEDKHEVLTQGLWLLWLSGIVIGAIIIWWLRRWEERRPRKAGKTKTYSQRLAERLAASKDRTRSQQRDQRQ